MRVTIRTVVGCVEQVYRETQRSDVANITAHADMAMSRFVSQRDLPTTNFNQTGSS